jgi:hypothetical protein
VKPELFRGSHLADQVFSFFVRLDGHGASSKVPVYSKPAQQSRLDGNQKALAGIALRTLESGYIIARCGRFDLGQPHGIVALGARQNSDFGPAVKWIGMDGWHDARLGSGGSAILSVTGKSLYGAVMQQHTLPGSGAAAQYWSVSETKHRQSDVWLTKESRLPLRASQPANSPQYLSSCFIYGVGTGII